MRIVERIRQVGAVSETTRIITTDDWMPIYWRLVSAGVLAGTTGIMIGLLIAAVAKRHGWIG